MVTGLVSLEVLVVMWCTACSWIGIRCLEFTAFEVHCDAFIFGILLSVRQSSTSNSEQVVTIACESLGPPGRSRFGCFFLPSSSSSSGLLIHSGGPLCFFPLRSNFRRSVALNLPMMWQFGQVAVTRGILMYSSRSFLSQCQCLSDIGRPTDLPLFLPRQTPRNHPYFVEVVVPVFDPRYICRYNERTKGHCGDTERRKDRSKEGNKGSNPYARGHLICFHNFRQDGIIRSTDSTGLQAEERPT